MHRDLLKPDEWRQKIRILKLGVIYPLSAKSILSFIGSAKQVLILEEHHPVVEMQVRSLVQMSGLVTTIFGKMDRCLSPTGEIFRWHLREVLGQLVPDLEVIGDFTFENEEKEKLKVKSYCEDCRYDEVLDLADKACYSLGLKPFYLGDPGCLVTVTGRIHAKYAMGSAVALASGFNKGETERFPIALFGDSSFFHSAIPAICDATHHESNILLILLDNGSALTTGGQIHPGSPGTAKCLSMTKIARKCGIAKVYEIELGTDKQLELMTEAVIANGLRLMRVIINNT